MSEYGGQYIEAGKLRFYVSPTKLAVMDDFQCYNIELTNWRYKARLPLLAGKIVLGQIDSWDKLYKAMNEHDEYGDIKARIFTLKSTRREWLEWQE